MLSSSIYFVFPKPHRIESIFPHVSRLADGVERRDARRDNGKVPLVVSRLFPPMRRVERRRGENADHWSSHALPLACMKDIRPCVERKTPFSFSLPQDEERTKEKSTITNDYLYVYRFFYLLSARHTSATCVSTPNSNLEAALNILICLNFTIPIISTG